MNRLKRFLGETDGHDVAEFGILASFISVTVIAFVTVVSTTDFDPVRSVHHGIETVIAFAKAVLGI